jgi:hypothetical protein
LPAYSRIGEPWWDDRPLAIVGAGPSIQGLDLTRIRDTGCRVLAVKQTVLDMPWADCGFGLHVQWPRDYKRELEASPVPLILALPLDEERTFHLDRPDVTYVRRGRDAGFSLDPESINSGGNSGYGAINLAVLKKARDVVLFGYDYDTLDGHHHYDGERYRHYNTGNAGYWVPWARLLDANVDYLTKIGMKVLNASLRSRLKAFPKLSHDDALAYLRSRA